MSSSPAFAKSRVLISLSPTIAFLVVNYGFGLTEAMIAASLTSVLAIGFRWRKGRRIGAALLGCVAISACAPDASDVESESGLPGATFASSGASPSRASRASKWP